MNFLFPEWENASEVLDSMVDTFFEPKVTFNAESGSASVTILDVPIERIPIMYRDMVMFVINSVISDFTDTLQEMLNKKLSTYIHNCLDEKIICEIKTSIMRLITQLARSDIGSLKDLLRERLHLSKEEK